MRTVFGYLLIATPFILLTIGLVIQEGWRKVVSTWLVVIIIISMMGLGVYLTD